MSQAMLHDLQLNYDYFYKTIGSSNISSIKLAEKCGFQIESPCVKTRWLHTILKVDNGTQYLYSYSVGDRLQ